MTKSKKNFGAIIDEPTKGVLLNPLKRAIWGLLIIPVIAMGAWGQTISPATRSSEIIQKDLDAEVARLDHTTQGVRGLRTAQDREKVAPQAIPILRQILVLVDELEKAVPEAKDQLESEAVPKFRVYLLAFGDTQAEAEIARLAEAGGNSAATVAAMRAAADFLKADGDAARQIKAMDEYGAALKAAPNDDAIADLCEVFLIGPPTREVSSHLLTIFREEQKQNPDLQQLADQLEDRIKLDDLLHKTLIIKGTTTDGATLSTADLKGRVVVLDFWATWCVPCVAELPAMEAFYAQNHSKGLEIVGIPNDDDGQVLRKFLAANPDMKWPQLFDDKNAGVHLLEQKLGVHIFPTIFVIDKKGIVRSVDAAVDYKELALKLLNESAN